MLLFRENESVFYDQPRAKHETEFQAASPQRLDEQQVHAAAQMNQGNIVTNNAAYLLPRRFVARALLGAKIRAASKSRIPMPLSAIKKPRRHFMESVNARRASIREYCLLRY